MARIIIIYTNTKYASFCVSRTNGQGAEKNKLVEWSWYLRQYGIINWRAAITISTKDDGFQPQKR